MMSDILYYTLFAALAAKGYSRFLMRVFRWRPNISHLGIDTVTAPAAQVMQFVPFGEF
jgi:hypothetical protein